MIKITFIATILIVFISSMSSAMLFSTNRKAASYSSSVSSAPVTARIKGTIVLISTNSVTLMIGKYDFIFWVNDKTTIKSGNTPVILSNLKKGLKAEVTYMVADRRYLSLSIVE